MADKSKILVSIGRVNSGRRLLDLPPNFFSLTIEESIYSFLPTAKIEINDITGLVIEGFYGSIGNTFEISVGAGNEKIVNEFAVVNYATKKSAGIDFAPKLQWKLSHKEIINQTKLSTAYRGRISEVIRQVFPGYQFADVNDTGNNSIWYQMNETNIDFVENIMKYAYSNNSNQTPFFLWLGVDNKIRLKNANSMELKKPKKEFYVGTSNQSNAEVKANDLAKIDDRSLGIINSTGIRQYVKSSTGEIESTDYYNSVFPLTRQGKISKANSGQTINSEFLFLEKSTEIGQIENQKGMIINSKKESYFTEHYSFFVLATEDNLKITAGDTIYIHAKIASNPDSSSLSPFFERVPFVVEKRIISWNSESSTMNIFFVVGRRRVNVNVQAPVYPAMD